jgi:hypothetical protein
MRFADVLEAVRSRVYMPDPAPLEVALATYAANCITSAEPLWVFLVGPPSGAKTDVLSLMSGLPHTRLETRLTAASLLTCHGREEGVDPYDAGFGILRDGGSFFILLVPEGSAIVVEGRRLDSDLFAVLRPISTDGHYERTVKGQQLGWRGKLGWLGATTEAIYELRMGDLGERFLYFPLPPMSLDEEIRGGMMALNEERPSLEEVRPILHEFIHGLQIPSKPPKLTEDEKRRIVHLATFCTRCRSTVGWGGTHGDEVVNLRQPERNPRLSRGCQSLLHGLRLPGIEDPECWRVLRQVALGSIPSRKRQVLRVLLGATAPLKTSGVAARTRIPETSVERDLHELCAFDVLVRHGDYPVTWAISAQYRRWWEEIVGTWGAVDLETLCEPRAEIFEMSRLDDQAGTPQRRETIGDLVGDF